jgi:hypothetical protein
MQRLSTSQYTHGSFYRAQIFSVKAELAYDLGAHVELSAILEDVIFLKRIYLLITIVLLILL